MDQSEKISAQTFVVRYRMGRIQRFKADSVMLDVHGVRLIGPVDGERVSIVVIPYDAIDFVAHESAVLFGA